MLSNLGFNSSFLLPFFISSHLGEQRTGNRERTTCRLLKALGVIFTVCLLDSAVAHAMPAPSNTRVVSTAADVGDVDAAAVETNYWIINTLEDSLNTVDATSCSDGTASDSNACSLRDAITQANAAGRANVAFAPSLFISGTPAVAKPGTITLGMGTASDIPLPEITGKLTLIGPGANLLTVSGDNDSIVGTVLTVESGALVNVSGFTIANGSSNGNAGGIDNQGSLSLSGVVLANNQASNWGGGVYNEPGATLSISSSTFNGNSVRGDESANGGAIMNAGLLDVAASTFYGNKVSALSGAGTGGAIENGGGGVMAVTNSTFAGNSSTSSGGGIHNGGQLSLGNDILAGNTANGNPDNCYNCGTQNSPNLIGLPKGVTLNQILGSLAYSPATASVQVMIPLPGASILCQGSASLLPAGVTTDERGFPMDPQCKLGAIDLGAAQTNYTNYTFQAPNGVVNQTLAPAPTIQVLETNALTGAKDGAGGLPVNWWLTGTASPYTGSPLTPSHGTSTTKAGKTSTGGVDNMATLSGLNVSIAGQYTMTAQTGGTSQQSNSFLVDDATVAQLAFTTPPASTVNAGAAQPNVKVALASASGIPITSATGYITLQVTDPNNNTVSYPGVATVNGTATISLKILTVAGHYTYTASYQPSVDSTPLTASAPQTVKALAAARIVVSGYPPAWWVGVPAYATVSALDRYGNPTTASFTATVVTGDPKAVINPAEISFNEGSAQVSVTFASAATRSITVALGTTTSGVAVAPEAKILIQAPPKFVVNNKSDRGTGASDCAANPTGAGAGACTLRDALGAAQNYGTGTITFDPTVFAATNGTAANTITLANGVLTIPPNTAITGLTTGSGASLQNLVTVDGSQRSEVFSFLPDPSTAAASIANLNVVNGAAGSSNGGGIYNSGVLTVTNCTVAGNTAGYSGGGIFNEYGTLAIASSTISGNSANGGGGIYSTGYLTVTNSTISGNNGGAYSSGGGIQNHGGTATVNGSTFNGNTAGYGGGITNTGGMLTLANSIVSGNGTDDIDGDYSNAGGNVVGYFNGNAVNTTLINLAPLGNYGGAMQTMVPLPGSPAICAGAAANIPAGVTKDERGLPNTNSAYPGYANRACVDSGAVQTNYSIALTISKSLSANVGKAITPAPVVTLKESGKAAAFATGTVNISDTGNALNSQSTTSVDLNAGSAAFSNLVPKAIVSSDSLTAILALNPAITPPVALSQTSAPFAVAGQTQTITISVSPAGTQYALKTATLGGTSTSGQTPAFSTSSSNCNISADGKTVSYSAGGSCVITASVPANSNFAAATASQTLTVALAPQTITFTIPTAQQRAGGSATQAATAGATTFLATASSGLSVTLSSLSIGICTVTGQPGSQTISFLAPGTCTMAANQGGDSTVWAKAPTVLKSISVE